MAWWKKDPYIPSGVKLNGADGKRPEVDEDRAETLSNGLLVIALLLIGWLIVTQLLASEEIDEANGIDTPTPVTSSGLQGEVNGSFDIAPKLVPSSKGAALVEDYQDGDTHSYVFYLSAENGGHTVEYGSDYEVVILKDGQGESAYLDRLEHKLYVHESEIATIRSGEYRRELVPQEEDGIEYLVAERDGKYDFLSKAVEDGDYGVDDRISHHAVDEVVFLDDPENLAYVEGTLEVKTPAEDNWLIRPQAFFKPKTLYVSRSMIRQTNQLYQEYLDSVPDPAPEPVPVPCPYPEPKDYSTDYRTYAEYREYVAHLEQVNV